jgi:lysophosphatidic acid acyltransferase/lysophosphatidylinositol acyltransferase
MFSLSEMVFLGEWWSGSEVEVVGPPEDVKYFGKEHGLVVMNHKYDIDWLAGWILAERCGILGVSKLDLYSRQHSFICTYYLEYLFCYGLILMRFVPYEISIFSLLISGRFSPYLT